MRKNDILRKNIKEFRELKGLTQSDMAEKLHMSETGYAKLERGETQIKVDRMLQIAQILDVDILTLTTSKEEGQVIFANHGDNFQNGSLFYGSNATSLELEIKHLKEMILMKNELLDSRDQQIETLKSKINTLEEQIAILKTQQ